MKSDTRTRTDRATEAYAKIEAPHERLATAVEGLVTSENWRQAMAFAATFRSRFRNCALRADQHAEAYSLGLVPNPTPAYVTRYYQRRSLGRAVRNGAHGYQILGLNILGQLDTDQIGNSDPPGLTRHHKGPGAALSVDASAIQPTSETVRQVGR